MRDLGRRFFISLALAGIILGGMAVTFDHLPSAGKEDEQRLIVRP
ncbi:protein YkpC [Metabacillus mangrovi]|nr:protein YkpC [Metabacillus mangrovi]